jgi:two-component sensor histidine kinase
MGRLQALASAQDLIPDLGWGCADLADVVEKSVLPFQADNIHTAGPHVLLGPKVVSTLSLALHELATNSTKYGALSASGGSVEVFWTIEQQETLMLRFRWIEAGGPEVVFPVRSGFGSRILGELVQLELRATTRIDFRPSGVIYEIVAPVASLCMEPGSGQLPRTGG